MTLYIQAASPRARKPISAHEPSAYRTSHSDNFHIHDHSRDAFPHVINSLSMWRPTSCKRAVHICYTHHLQPGSSPVFPPISHSCAFSGVLRGLLFRMHTHLFVRHTWEHGYLCELWHTTQEYEVFFTFFKFTGLPLLPGFCIQSFASVAVYSRQMSYRTKFLHTH